MCGRVSVQRQLVRYTVLMSVYLCKCIYSCTHTYMILFQGLSYTNVCIENCKLKIVGQSHPRGLTSPMSNPVNRLPNQSPNLISPIYFTLVSFKKFPHLISPIQPLLPPHCSTNDPSSLQHRASTTPSQVPQKLPTSPWTLKWGGQIHLHLHNATLLYYSLILSPHLLLFHNLF